MVVIPEQHAFSSTIGGYQCLTCSAFLSDSTLSANTPSITTVEDAEALSADPNSVLNLAYKKAGLP